MSLGVNSSILHMDSVSGKASQGLFLRCRWSGAKSARASGLILGPLGADHMVCQGVGVGVGSE